MSASPDWQPNLRNVKQYGITVSKPKFITLDNRTSAIFNEAAVSASSPDTSSKFYCHALTGYNCIIFSIQQVQGFSDYHKPRNEANTGFRASISMSTMNYDDRTGAVKNVMR